MMWTREMDARLEELAAAGLSARKIAEAVSSPYWRVTRNAVIGRAHRTGIKLMGDPWWDTPEGRATNAETRRERALVGKTSVPLRRRRPRIVCVAAHNEPVRQYRPVPPPIPRERAFLALPGAPEPVSFMNLRIGHCRWPITFDDGETRYCGLPRGRSYCDAHAAMARRAS